MTEETTQHVDSRRGKRRFARLVRYAAIVFVLMGGLFWWSESRSGLLNEAIVLDQVTVQQMLPDGKSSRVRLDEDTAMRLVELLRRARVVDSRVQGGFIHDLLNRFKGGFNMPAWMSSRQIELRTESGRMFLVMMHETTGELIALRSKPEPLSQPAKPSQAFDSVFVCDVGTSADDLRSIIDDATFGELHSGIRDR